MVRTTDLFVWTRVPPGTTDASTGPPPSCCQSMVAFEEKLYLFGGAVLGTTFNDLFSFDLATSTWKREVTSNAEVASGRMSHTAVMVDDRMVVYGGMDLQVIHGDLLSLNMRTMEWSSLPCNGSDHPGSRRSHAAAVYNHRMYVMMGLPMHPPPDLWAYDFITHRWAQERTEQRFGTPPVSVHGHTLEVERDAMYMFGGCVQTPQGQSSYFNNLYAYYFKSGMWSEISTSASPRPSPRYSHVMAALHGRIVVHGGDSNNCLTYFDDLWSIDVRVEKPTWHQHHRTGPSRPCARSGHCAVVQGGSLFVFGGEAPGTDAFVNYSGQLYRIPLSLSMTLPLTELCGRWLAKTLRQCDIEDVLASLSVNAKMLVFKYYPSGGKEVLSAHHYSQ